MILRNSYRKLAAGAALLVLMTGMACKRSLDDISVNPNRAEKTNPANLLTNLCIDAFGAEFLGINRQLDNFYIDWRFGGAHLNWNRRNFTAEYRQITIAGKMEEEAKRLQQPAYVALSRFFKAYWIFTITRLYGDVPFSEANRVSEGISLPRYDAQEDIVAGVLQELKTANEELAGLEGGKLQGDIIYGGDIRKWRRLVNMFRLRVLINLSMKDKLKGESVPQLFAQVVTGAAASPLMEKLEDSPIRTEQGNPENYYLYLDNNFISGYRITQFVAEHMKARGDFRLTVFAQPTIYAENNNLDPNELNNYAGTNPWPNKANNINYQLEDSKKISRVNNRYHREPVGPPTMVMGYAEQEFILAEAALRGWISADPAKHYENGIRASFAFFGVGNRANAYLASPLVKLEGTASEKLGRIITEKYMSFFMQGGYEPYFEMRRTGYPDFKAYVAPDISTLYNNGRLPLRYLYPLGEITDNKSNVLQAIDRLPGGDDIFSKMWLLEGQDDLRNGEPFPYQ